MSSFAEKQSCSSTTSTSLGLRPAASKHFLAAIWVMSYPTWTDNKRHAYKILLGASRRIFQMFRELQDAWSPKSIFQLKCFASFSLFCPFKSVRDDSPSSCSCFLQRWRKCQLPSPGQQSPQPGSPDDASWRRPRWPKLQLRRRPM